MSADTLVGAFRETARRRGEAIALEFEGLRFSHARLDRLSDLLAARLSQVGLTSGDRAGVCLANGPALVVAHLAIGKLGAVRLCLNPAYRAEELSFILKDAQPKLMLAEADGKPLLESIGYGQPVLVPDEGDDPFGAESAEAPKVSVGPDEDALMAYTSGTTGRPKGAVLTQRNLLSNIEALAGLWRWSESERLLLALPMFHMHGLGLGLHGTLLTGATMILHRKFDADRVWRELVDRNATLFMGVPTMYERLLDSPAAPDAIESMRLFISGSAPLATETWRAFRDRFGQEILERYGLTETVMNASNPYEGQRKPGSVGQPVPGVEVRIDRPDPETGAGEIRVKGPNVFRGYWNRPEATAEAFDEAGYFKTGDIGRMEEGYLTICGRLKELIITGGFNVYPREVEEALGAHPAIVESAVLGVPDRKWGERVIAFCVLSGGGAANGEALGRFLSQRLTPYKIPKEYRFIDALPRNAMGKLMKSALAQRLEDEEGA